MATTRAARAEETLEDLGHALTGIVLIGAILIVGIGALGIVAIALRRLHVHHGWAVLLGKLGEVRQIRMGNGRSGKQQGEHGCFVYLVHISTFIKQMYSGFLAGPAKAGPRLRRMWAKCDWSGLQTHASSGFQRVEFRSLQASLTRCQRWLSLRATPLALLLRCLCLRRRRRGGLRRGRRPDVEHIRNRTGTVGQVV